VRYTGRAQAAAAALVDGQMGIVVAPRGRLLFAIRVELAGERIRAFDVIGEPARLSLIEVAAVDGGHGPAPPDAA
jgi:RNA polymerase sigma-70 factor (ECF subfamily)